MGATCSGTCSCVHGNGRRCEVLKCGDVRMDSCVGPVGV